MKRLFPILAGLTAIFLAYALYLALVVAPTDAQQGEVYRIIYYHVPSAWTAFLLFFINFIASIQYLVSKKASTQAAAKWVVLAIGVVGVVACFLPQVQALLPVTLRCPCPSMSRLPRAVPSPAAPVLPCGGRSRRWMAEQCSFPVHDSNIQTTNSPKRSRPLCGSDSSSWCPAFSPGEYNG